MGATFCPWGRRVEDHKFSSLYHTTVGIILTKPKGPTLGAKDEAAPISPPMVRTIE